MALIMVAEDDPTALRMSASLLESQGHQVIAASDGPEMVELAQRWRPELIVADVMMPGVYGSTAHKRLLADSATADIPVVFLTAAPLAQVRRLVEDSPRVRLLAKPFDTRALLNVVASLLPA